MYFALNPVSSDLSAHHQEVLLVHLNLYVCAQICHKAPFLHACVLLVNLLDVHYKHFTSTKNGWRSNVCQMRVINSVMKVVWPNYTTTNLFFIWSFSSFFFWVVTVYRSRNKPLFGWRASLCSAWINTKIRFFLRRQDSLLVTWLIQSPG